MIKVSEQHYWQPANTGKQGKSQKIVANHPSFFGFSAWNSRKPPENRRKKPIFLPTKKLLFPGKSFAVLPPNGSIALILASRRYVTLMHDFQAKHRSRWSGRTFVSLRFVPVEMKLHAGIC
jgi:hypothetical protein